MISIPRINADDIAKYYSLIRVSYLGVAAPIECIDNSVDYTWEAPSVPTEKNTYICDTIFEKPKEVSMSVFVKTSMLKVFESQIALTLLSGIGFNIFTMGGIYSNMFVTSLTRSETADVSTGYKLDITFQEVPITGLLSMAIEIGSSAIAAAVNTMDGGTTNPRDQFIGESLDSAVKLGIGYM